VLFGLATLVSSSNICAAVQSMKSDAKVKASVVATKPDDKGMQKVTITLKIDDGWYIYANPASDDEFIKFNRTMVTFKADKNFTAFVRYPPGVKKTDTIGKEVVEYFAYEKQVVIQAELRRSNGDASPLKIEIEVNACRPSKNGKGGECLPTGTLMLTSP
jgi:DsbC/DsbD-like thiol-disulfide interchange protein